MDVGRVIKALECCRNGFCFTCPYNDGIDESTDCKQRWAEDAIALLKAQEPITGETSDGYHTFNELYHHRAVLFSVIVANYPDRSWKSKKHHDGTMYNGMFIVGIDTPDGQATYHYDVEPYWDIFKCRVLDNAPEWDGHTPAQAIERIGKLKAHEPRVMTLEEVEDALDTVVWVDRPGMENMSEAYARISAYSRVNKEIMLRYGFIEKPKTKIEAYVDYGISYRCWTSRPTDARREAEPWSN